MFLSFLTIVDVATGSKRAMRHALLYALAKSSFLRTALAPSHAVTMATKRTLALRTAATSLSNSFISLWYFRAMSFFPRSRYDCAGDKSHVMPFNVLLRCLATVQSMLYSGCFNTDCFIINAGGSFYYNDLYRTVGTLCHIEYGNFRRSMLSLVRPDIQAIFAYLGVLLACCRLLAKLHLQAAINIDA